jgi:hypothetical protein
VLEEDKDLHQQGP